MKLNLKRYAIGVLIATSLIVLPTNENVARTLLPPNTTNQTNQVEIGVALLNPDGTFIVTVEGKEYIAKVGAGPLVLNLPTGCAIVLAVIVLGVAGYVIYNIIKLCKKIPQINTNTPPSTNGNGNFKFSVSAEDIETNGINTNFPNLNLPSMPIKLLVVSDNVNQPNYTSGMYLQGVIHFELQSSTNFVDWITECIMSGTISNATLNLQTFSPEGVLLGTSIAPATPNSFDAVYVTYSTNKVVNTTNLAKVFRLKTLAP